MLTEIVGDPTENGMYVAYVDPVMNIPYADKKLLMFINGKWGYRSSSEDYSGCIYGWIGPIPALKFDEED